MPVCKFFLRGNCRKGNNCNFEHVSYDSEDSYGPRGGGTSVLKRDNTSDTFNSYQEKSYDDNTHYSKRYDRRADDYDRNVHGHYVTVSNDYYVDHRQDQRQNQQYAVQQRYSNDRYHYDPRQAKQQFGQQQNITVDDIYTLLKADIQLVESSKIWPLTSLCVVKLFGSLDDWYDYSPEEIRLAAYIAKSSNNFEGYKSTTDKIISRAQITRDFYKNTSKDASMKLKKYLNQNGLTIFPVSNNELDFSCVNISSINLANVNNDVGTQPFGTTQQSSVEDDEMSSSSQKAENIFGSSQSSEPGNVFGQQQPSSFSANIFGAAAQPEPPKNIFGGFAQSEQPTKNVFGDFAQNNQASVFGSSRATDGMNFQQLASSSSSFPQSFQQAPYLNCPSDINKVYPKLSQTDLDVDILSIAWHGYSPYSLKTDITDEEYDQFKAPKFSLDKLPLIPPPKELC